MFRCCCDPVLFKYWQCCRQHTNWPLLPVDNMAWFTHEQNGWHFADDILKCIFLNEHGCILIQSSLKFVPKDVIDDKLALFQVMAWCQIGDKSLCEPSMTLLTHTKNLTKTWWVFSYPWTKMAQVQWAIAQLPKTIQTNHNRYFTSHYSQ